MDHYERNLQKKIEIESGLLELMQQIPFSQINVTLLSSHLGTSRKSFYHYFPNLDACLESLIQRMIRDAALYSTKMSPASGGGLDTYIHNLEYWRSQSAFLSAISRNQLDSRLLHHYVAYCVQENRELWDRVNISQKDSDEDILFFFASGHINLLLRWSQRGFQPPVKEMARKIMHLMTTPMISPAEK